MNAIKKDLRMVGYGMLAAVLTIVTLGGYLRFHLVTVRRRTLGGVRAGKWGGIHVYREGTFLVVSRWRGKQRFPVAQISYAETGMLKVRVATSGSRRGKKLVTWQTRTVSAFINAQVPTTVRSAA
jgi:hypothetical protein